MNATRAEMPAGTVTMLFTDIEGSTRAVRALGADRWEAVLERHTRIIRDALASGGGVEVRTEGDSFFAVFTSPNAALAAAAEMQRRLNAADWGEMAVRVRMGIHTGEARPASVASGVDYVGFEVSRAAFTQELFDDSRPLDPQTLAVMVRELGPRYPHVLEIAMAASHDEGSIVGQGCDDQFEFEFALDLLLDGFETLQRSAWTSRT